MENKILKELLNSKIILAPSDGIQAAEPSGENRAGLLLVTAEPEHDEFLQKVFSSVGFDLAKDALLLHVTPKQQASFAGLLRKSTLKHCFIFGVPAERLGLQWKHPLYQYFRAGDQLFYFAHGLSKIQEDVKLKRKLWNALKELYPNQS